MTSVNYQLLSVNCTGGAASPRPRIAFRGDWLPEMGFVSGALVQALPEPDGFVFNLCNENVNYSDLFNSTKKKGGGLIRVYTSEAKGHGGPTFVTSGKYIYSGGLKMRDAIIAKYDHGMIRVRKIDPRKLGFKNLRLIMTTYITRKYANVIPKVRLCGDWLNEIGFTIDSLATAASVLGGITLNLQAADPEYNALMKYARGHRMKIVQVYKEPHNRGEQQPCIGITGSCVDTAGFKPGDTLAASYDYGVIKLQTLDFKKLGF